MATIETDENRTYVLIDIPCRVDFVQDVNSIKEIDIKRIKSKLSKLCQRCAQDMATEDLKGLEICLIRSIMVVSADMISEVRIQFVYYQTNH